MLENHCGVMAQYLDGKCVHPVWKPVASQDGLPAWDRADRPRLRSLRMLESPSEGHPDLLLYQLGNLEQLDPSFAARLDSALAGDEHVYLSNASGTGKTRMSFEILSRHWGIYFSSYVNYTSDPYGSLDLSRALSEIAGTRTLTSRFTSFIPPSARLSQNSKDALDENRRIAHRFFRRLVLARMLLLDAFLKLAAERRIPDDEARRHWLMIQLRPGILLGHDSFNVVFIWLRRLSEDQVDQLSADILPKVLSHIAYIVVDEAQILLDSHRSAFAVANGRTTAPILRELVVCLGAALSPARLILSGVRFDLDLVSEALSASDFKQKSVRHHHSFGRFHSLQQCSTYIRHFLGPGVPDEHCTMVYRWLHGRHRIIAVLVTLALRFGALNLTRVMDSFIYRLTGYQRPDSSILHSGLIDCYTLAIKNEHIEASAAAIVLRRATLSYALQGLPTRASCHALELVGLGAALYEHSADEAAIFEPFIFLNLARWLESSVNFGIHGIIRRRLAGNTYHPLHSVAFVEGLAPCLLAAIGSGTQLDQILVFPGRKPPWALHPASVVLPRLSHRSSPFAAVSAESHDHLHWAATSADVLAWFENAPKAFLIPDSRLGADLLFFLEVHELGHLLVCVHAEPFVSIRTRRQTQALPPGGPCENKPDTQEHFLTALTSLHRNLTDVLEDREEPEKPQR